MQRPKVKILESIHDKDQFLFRYLTFDKLLDFLVNGRLMCSRLDNLEDNLEGTTVEHLLMNFAGNKIGQEMEQWMGSLFKLVTTSGLPNTRNSYRRKRELFQQQNFANCWYLSNNESIAMWKLYSTPDSVAIKVKKDAILKLFQSEAWHVDFPEVKEVVVGPVSYCNFNDIDELSDLVKSDNEIGFIKDSSFEHEKELRILLKTNFKNAVPVKRKDGVLDEHIDRMNKSIQINTIPIELKNFKSIPFEIIFHPQAKDWHIRNINSLIEQYNLDFSTIQSNLKDIFS